MSNIATSEAVSGVEVARMSTLTKNMVDDSGTDEEIPLFNVKTLILSKVFDYCKYHKDILPEEMKKPLKSTNLMECGVSEWYHEYADGSQLLGTRDQLKICHPQYVGWKITVNNRSMCITPFMCYVLLYWGASDVYEGRR